MIHNGREIPDGELLRAVQSITGWINCDPLHNDAHSSRLEAELMLHVEWHPGMQTVRVGTAEIWSMLPWGTDRQAARRRAGVAAVYRMYLATAQQNVGLAAP